MYRWSFLYLRTKAVGAKIVGKFIRETGHFKLDGSGSTLSITKESASKWSVNLVWQEGPNLSLKDSPDVLHSAGWFIYVETRDRIWIYDGDKHLIFEGHENKHIVGGMSPEIRATCPKEVLEALPEKARGNKQA